MHTIGYFWHSFFKRSFFERGSLISNNGTRTFFTASNRGFLPKNFLKKLLKVQINFVLSLKTSNSHGDGLENPETPSRILSSGMRHQGCQNPRDVKSTNHLCNMRYMPVQVTLMLIICVGKPITVTYLGSV